MRRCGRCGESKPFGEFNWRRREQGQRDNYCRPCRAEYKQEHYTANKQQYVRNAMRRKRRELERRMVWLIDYLRRHPCVDCGETDPVVLEFDHFGPKRWDINKGMRDHRWEDVLAEIAKCEVVCANCHRRRTAERGGFLRAAVAQR